MFDAEELLTYAEAAEALRVSRATLFRMVSEGRLAAIKHANRSYIERREIADYFDRLRAEAVKARAARARATTRSNSAAPSRRGTSATAGRPAA